MPLTQDDLLRMYRMMLLIRRFEERATQFFMNGQIRGSFHPCIGQEATAVGGCFALRTDDYMTCTYRGHGQSLAKGLDAKEAMAELLGRRTGCSKGKGGSMHFADFSLGILGANGVVAGGFPIIVGAGLSIKLRHTDQVAVCFFGDGASNRGPFHEAMNMASIWKLPILFVCENNCYASTTLTTYACSVTSIAKRAAGYNVPGITVDGNDVLAVREAAGRAVDRARRGEGPTLLENMTYRRRGHFEGDPQKYRNQAEVAEWEKRDPLLRFASVLKKEKILTGKREKEIDQQVDGELQEAVAFAEQSEWPRPEEALEDMFINP